jgi:purine-nucleoside phosphorylase
LHAYEGHTTDVVGLPVLAAAGAGARFAILTNSVGALRTRYAPGTLALLADLLDLRGPSGPASRLVPRSPSLEPHRTVRKVAFDPALTALVDSVAVELGISLPRAVYAGVTGPSYETPAEVRMLRGLGADLVAMSVAAEATSAADVGLPVAGVSVVSNLATGLRGERLEHDEVVEAGNRAAGPLGRLILGVVERIGREGTRP